ncbi:HNH endonuclease [Rhodococcus sp. BH5]|uniref:HNH endonuclease n=1 Tax=Rhodococcus sp. BH5 TaxID=2871702 RepID=UPI003FA73F53
MSTSYLWQRDGNQCRICDQSIDMMLTYPDMMRASVDHILPYSLGGTHHESNLQLAHLRCNLIKQKRIGFKIPNAHNPRPGLDGGFAT